MEIAPVAKAASGRRIESLDVLRTFVLFGILIVHCENGFGLLDTAPVSKPTLIAHWIIQFLLANKCNIAFTTLFGASFGLILRNKANTSARFMWRCLLLIGFGVLNKLFYWYDALMAFGVLGILIIPYRHLRPRTILIVTTAIYFLIPVVWPLLDAGTVLFGGWTPVPQPDISTTSLSDLLHRPLWEGIASYAYVVTIHGGILQSFMYMAVGYVLVRKDIISHMEDYLRGRYVALLWALTAIAIYFQFFVSLPPFLSTYKEVANPIACYTYCYTILYVFHRWKSVSRLLLTAAPYGRMSLTNYTMQSIISVSIFTAIGQTAASFPLIYFIAYIFGLWGMQLVFSYYWMKYMNFGPMEWIWRVLTKTRYVPLLRRGR